METRTSAALFARAQRLIPGGVNSPVRAFGSVGGTPRFIARARGARLWDADGNEYLDAVGSWGPMILGHAHPRVLAAVEAALQGGTSFGAPTEREVRLAERVLERYPGCERVRFVNSGTEATMSALRVARGATGRDVIVKFAGNYHGHADALLVAAGSGAMTTGVPSSAGVPKSTAETTLVARYNDLPSVRALFEARPRDIAAVILEPVVGNMGVVVPTPEFLAGLRALTREYGALLIVDEVMTGFRLARGGAVERFGLDADLVCWGKVIGGGLPVGAYGGPAHLMDHVSPLGKVYQAGTLSGNPLAMAAGIATLEVIDETPDLYEVLEARTAQLEQGLRRAAQDAGVPVTLNRVGSMLTVFFTDEPVVDFESASRTDTAAFGRWFHHLLARGVYWPASAFEAAFLSYAHTEADIQAMVAAAREAFFALAEHQNAPTPDSDPEAELGVGV
ncbi:glutamate-1-semialdehyde 2,1-aminomutase [Truepera radiovictrix]|uniref:Glutamate-1-semialdehyde 2,1-aminomutase n=1 Tax=Truepera radiovictrix (strain DSM 17093 / CIP 108686 / LMG 22925 / RQ-24) TaxID=649638 RepID=D7CW52_TRURR|nr:glutamate-1-semialdehyde 2,1-aminomutase [Truepera radiovictrix]ADI14315.1 glutamate-1-semialdehyde-2,1-aminomutase [Truepera radiovictrix DSM 17093]WMT57129.1 glutamate-1-semialdehyde 2,1-aminomutase [Truepera radiovictrix]